MDFNSTPIYLDYHATTPVDGRVADRVYHYMTAEFGNASSIDHERGDRAEDAINQAAKQVADLVGASPREIIWTSGATESINLAIQGSLSPNPVKPHRIALLPLEHKAILDTCQIYERRGWAELIYLEVDSQGRLNLDEIDRICAQGLSLLCVMAANNEIGNIYPIDRQRYSSIVLELLSDRWIDINCVSCGTDDKECVTIQSYMYSD
jgi:cysteine desulfurase